MTAKRPKKERMDNIVQSALAEFLEKGYENATMESIAGRAALSKGGLYHHFRSKDEILLYVNQKLTEPVQILMRQAEHLPSPARALRFYIQHYLKYWMDHPKHLTFFFLSTTRVLADIKIWGLYEQLAEETICFFQRLLAQGIKSGEFESHDTRARATVLMSSLDGVAGYLIIDRRLNYRSVCRGLEGVLLGPILRQGSPRRSEGLA